MSEDQTKPQNVEEAVPLSLTPELARAALVFMDRSTSQGLGEARTLLHICAVLESIARRGSE